MNHRHSLVALGLIFAGPRPRDGRRPQRPEVRATVVSLAASTGQAALFVNSVGRPTWSRPSSATGNSPSSPHRRAFPELPSSTLAELLRPENKDKFAKLLKYHIIPGGTLKRPARHHPSPPGGVVVSDRQRIMLAAQLVAVSRDPRGEVNRYRRR